MNPMQPPPVRVVYDSQPYLVIRDGEGKAAQAFGPFAPGTEPSLAECTPEIRVTDPDVLSTLDALVPLSPELPAHADTLAARE